MQKSFKTSSYTSIPPLVHPSTTAIATTTNTSVTMNTETPLLGNNNKVVDKLSEVSNKPIPNTRDSLDANGNVRSRRPKKTSLTSANGIAQHSQNTLTLGGFARTLLEKANDESGPHPNNDDELSPNSIRQLMFFQRPPTSNPKPILYHQTSGDEKEDQASSEGHERKECTQKTFGSNFTDSALGSISSFSVTEASELSLGYSSNNNNNNNKFITSGIHVIGSGGNGHLSTVMENSSSLPSSSSSVPTTMSSNVKPIIPSTSSSSSAITTSTTTTTTNNNNNNTSNIGAVARKFEEVMTPNINQNDSSKRLSGITIRQQNENKQKPSPPLMLNDPGAPLKCAVVVNKSSHGEFKPRHKNVLMSNNKYATISGTPKGFNPASFFDDNNRRSSNIESNKYSTLGGTPKGFPLHTMFDDRIRHNPEPKKVRTTTESNNSGINNNNNIRSVESKIRTTTDSNNSGMNNNNMRNVESKMRTTTITADSSSGSSSVSRPYSDWKLGFESVQNKEFLIIKTLGKGGSGEVYLVVEKETKELFAMKKVSLAGINDSIIKECVNEIQMLQDLKGTDLVIRIDSWEINRVDRTMKIIMEYGHSDLGASIKKSKFSLHEVRSTWESILKIVQIIHGKGIVHSDLKPANFVWVGNRLKIIDFGIASRLQNDTDTSIITMTPKGTVNYISPETISPDEVTGKLKIGPKSDIWSLGCILYLLVYGKTPFQDYTSLPAKYGAIIKGIVHYPPLPPQFEGSGVDSVLKSCLVIDHRKRPSATELLHHSFLPGPSSTNS